MTESILIVSEPSEVKPDEVADRRIDNLNLSEGELFLIKVMHYKTADRFQVALWDAITFAEADDLTKLRQVYPSHVDAYRSYKTVPGWLDHLISRLPQRRADDS